MSTWYRFVTDGRTDGRTVVCFAMPRRESKTEVTSSSTQCTNVTDGQTDRQQRLTNPDVRSKLSWHMCILRNDARSKTWLHIVKALQNYGHRTSFCLLKVSVIAKQNESLC